MTNVVAFAQVLKHTERPYLAQHFPERIGTYWEPFVGDGAVFFIMADRIDRATEAFRDRIVYNSLKSYLAL